MRMTTADYEAHVSDNAGYCTHCKKITMSDVEPDAEGYDCEVCGNPTVQGIENALIYENIIIDDEELGDSDGIIRFSEDEDDEDY